MNFKHVTGFFFPRIDELNLGGIWFQQDGAMGHTSRASLFWESTSQRDDLEWSVCFRGLTLSDLFPMRLFEIHVQKPYKIWRPIFRKKPKPAILIRAMTIATDQFTQCMGDVIKPIWSLKLWRMKTLGIRLHYGYQRNIFLLILWVLLSFEKQKLCCRNLYLRRQGRFSFNSSSKTRANWTAITSQHSNYNI